MRIDGTELDAGWASEFTHIVPGYGREHDTDGDECWCSPEVEITAAGEWLVRHREHN